MQWIIIPLVFFALAEKRVSQWIDQQATWYADVGRPQWETPPENVDFLFIGSSRVSAAIDATHFAEQGETPTTALNFGLGFSKPIQHLFGLRNLIEAHPEALEGVTVFLEAPAGLPEYETRDDPWYFKQSPQMLTYRMQADDMADFRTRAFPFAKRAEVERLYAMRGLRMFTYRNWLKRLIDRRFKQKITAKFGSKEIKHEAGDLGTDGGVRNDKAGIELVREAVKLEAIKAMQQPIPPYDQMILKEINELLTPVNGRIVLYDIPLSTVKRSVFVNAASAANREQLRTNLQARGFTTLLPDFKYTDEDFPDASHLRKSRKKEFTRSLFKAYRIWNKNPPQETSHETNSAKHQ